MPYIAGRFIFFLLAKLFLGYKSFARENIPPKGGVILASNHASFLDPILVGIGTARPLNFMARETLFKNFFFGNIIRSVHTFPVKRDFHDIGAMKEAITRLKNGKALLVFPEGTRTVDGNLQKAKSGVSFLAQTGNAPVVPVYVKGSFNVLPKGAKSVKFAPVYVYYGKALDFNEFMKQGKFLSPSDAYKPFSEEIMRRIADLQGRAQGPPLQDV